ncbi:hypothetical protein ACFX12_029679 [Malus domestica]
MGGEEGGGEGGLGGDGEVSEALKDGHLVDELVDVRDVGGVGYTDSRGEWVTHWGQASGQMSMRMRRKIRPFKSRNAAKTQRSSTPSPPSSSQRSSENPESTSSSSSLMSTALTISAPRSSALRSSSVTRSPTGVQAQGHSRGVRVFQREVEGCEKSWHRHRQRG